MTGAKPKTGSRTKRGTQPRTKGKPKKPPAPGVAKRRSAALAKKTAAALAKSRSKGAKGKSAGSKAGGAKTQSNAKPMAKPMPKPMPKPEAMPVLPQGELKTILQTASFPADPWVVYDLIMDEKKHAAFTGAAAIIGSKVGEAFSAYDGSCLGTHLELVKGSKIVQTWRESDWPEGHLSIATFMFAPGPEGTTLTFIQTGVPAEAYDGIDSGWKSFYWQPMREMLEAK
ncbi:MAG: SRPBCC family protein [Fibrobacteria bacterium]